MTESDERDAEDKGQWAETADEGVAPAEAGGPDPELGSAVVGQTTDSDEPATAEGIDRDAGEEADATSDGGAEPTPEGVEPDQKDIGAPPND